MNLPHVIKIGAIKTAAEFQARLQQEGLSIPCDESLTQPSPLAHPIRMPRIGGKVVGNRVAIQPMEGWDGTPSGGITDEVRRRWSRFGASGAKLILGGEAMAVRPDGRANPRQLILNQENVREISELVAILKQAHRKHHGSDDDLVVGFQLTHSGRFCRPHGKNLEPRVAFRHPLLEKKYGLSGEVPVFSDDEIGELIECFIRAAGLAAEAGADFVDIKHCHGYLLHEFLGAHTRPGRYGGSFENRTRILRDIVGGIRRSGNSIALGVRLSCFDRVPFQADPALSTPSRPGPGQPMPFEGLIPYRYGFGVDPQNPLEPDLTEPLAFVRLCGQLGIQVLNTTAGSPYYNPHIQRPAAFPPSDGYLPPRDPLWEVQKQIEVVRELKKAAPLEMLVVGSGYTYLQQFLPHVAQAVVREGWVDAVGVGRMILSYPEFLSDAMQGKTIETRRICRTFSDCTTAPRNQMISGCYPLDDYYTQRPENAELKKLKKTNVAPPAAGGVEGK